MAVHFNFIVEDHEAELIMESLTDYILSTCKRRDSYPVPSGYYDWHTAHIEYLRNIKSKMHNTRVPE